MRTTIHINDALLVRAKRTAADSGRTLTSFIEDALREALGRRARPAPRQHVKLTVFRGTGVQAGVDLDRNSSLADTMDRS